MSFNLIRSNITYAIGNAANSAMLVILVPILVRAIPAEEYGAWSIFEISITLLTLIINAGLYVGLMRQYWLFENKEQQQQLFSTALLAVVVWGAVVVGLGFIVVQLNPNLDLPNASNNLRWVLIISWIESIFNLFLVLLRIQERATIFIVLSVGRMLIFLGTTIFLLEEGWGVTGALVARFGATMGVLIVTIFLSINHIFATPRFDILLKIARYGLPLLGSDIAVYILFASDRYVMQSYLSLETIAIYTFAYKLATAADILVNRPFSIDWAPRRFKIAAEPATAPQKYSQILKFYLFAISSASLFVLAITPTFYDWLAPLEYHQGISLVSSILLIYIINGLSYPLNIGIMLKNKTHYLPIISGSAAAICLLLNFWLIPQYGMWGAVWATLVAYTVMTSMIAIVSLILYPVPYQLDQIVWIVIGIVIGFGGLKFFDYTTLANHNLLILTTKLVWITLLTLIGTVYCFDLKIKLFQQVKPITIQAKN